MHTNDDNTGVRVTSAMRPLERRECGRRRPRIDWIFAVAIATAVMLVVLAGGAQAKIVIDDFDGAVSNSDGTAATQAASHPYEAWTSFEIATNPPNPFVLARENLKSLSVDLPPGLVGNPLATPSRCTTAQMQRDPIACPVDSQIGVVFIRSTDTGTTAVYNMEPPPGVPARFAFKFLGVVVNLDASLVRRTDSQYALRIALRNASQGLIVNGSRVTFWGVPSDPSHDALRGLCLTDRRGSLCPTDAPRNAFLTNPTACTAPGVGLETTMTVDSWQSPGQFASASFMSHLPPPDEAQQQGPDGCDLVPFDARLSVKPNSVKAGAPSGYGFELTIPQNDEPAGLAQAHLRKAVVRLPAGVSVSPSAADGLGACEPARIGVDNMEEPSCPDSSKLGSVRIDTPLLEAPMDGEIYLAKPHDNPFDSLLALYLVARGPGIVLKLPGKIDPDPVTGQLTATFDNNPQLPFSSLQLAFKQGPRAALVNPPRCGTYTTVTQMTSWSGKIVTSTSDFTISRDGLGAPCPPRTFTPDFSAGLTNPTGGTSSAFSLTFARDDEDPTLRDITVALPEGLTGVIASADLCPGPQAEAGTCGERSRVGSTTTGAGGGPNPFFVSGRVYITGPYKGAPFGMSIVVPVVAGPFNLGTVVVRAAIFVDRKTAQLRVAADPLPSILEGIPLLIRTVNVTVDKPGFMRSPTSCAAKRVAAQVGSNEGMSAAVGSRFQVGNCGVLPYKPKLAIKIGGVGRTAAESTTPLQAVLTMPRGSQANNKSVEVTLPSNVNSRLAALRGACSVEAAQARTCGRTAVIGSATAVTPLLRDPLRGAVYIVRTVGNRLPDIWVALRGQVEFDLIGRVRIVGSRLLVRTTFAEVPDVPVSKFTLNFNAGRQGAIGLVRGLCSAAAKKSMVAGLSLRAQNGDLVTANQKMSISGCGRASSGRRASGRRGSRRNSRRS